MLCENCKTNNATVHMTQIVNGDKEEIHLCESCAKSMQIISPISFQDIFKGMLDLSGYAHSISEKGQKQDTGLACKGCGLKYEDFRKNGLLGCAQCYSAFQEQLRPMLKRMNGSNVHGGKFPQKADASVRIKRESARLKKQLEQAIVEEQYEEAARIRDEIKSLEGGLLQ